MARPRTRPEKPKRARGGQPGNSNALRTGRHTVGMVWRRDTIAFMRRRARLTLAILRWRTALHAGTPLPLKTRDRIAKTLDLLDRRHPAMMAEASGVLLRILALRALLLDVPAAPAQTATAGDAVAPPAVQAKPMSGPAKAPPGGDQGAS